MTSDPKLAADPGTVRECLSKVLSSTQFERAGRTRILLEFLVSEALEGRSAVLKESVIGLQVFERDASYDPKLDPVVRVTVGRLRAKLEQYYEREGAIDRVRFEIPKGAYVPVFVVVPGAPDVAVPAPTQQAPRRLAFVLAAVAVVIAALGILYWARVRPVPPTLSGVRPFISEAGSPTHPSFSPSGDTVAFDWSGPSDKFTNIYLQRIDSTDPVRLTKDVANDTWAAWSPDGRQIAFVRSSSPQNAAIFTMPVFGNGERKWFEVSKSPSDRPRLSWSPDGKWFATAERVNGISSIVVFSLATGEKRVLTRPPDGWRGDSEPTFSPDTSTVAFRRTRPASGDEDIYFVPISGGEPRVITTDRLNVSAFVFTPDRGLLFSSRRAGSIRSLWWMPPRGGEFVLVSPPAVDAGAPAVSLDGRHIAFVKVLFDADIWRISTTGSGEAVQVTSSEFPDYHPRYSPDGSQLLFISLRSGAPELWISDPSGAKASRLTEAGGAQIGASSWSPDGRQIVFDWRSKGKEGLYVISRDGGTPRPLVTDPHQNGVPRWSRDGNFVYFNSNRSGSPQIYRIPATGGEAIQITANTGSASQQSEDGAFLYFNKPQQPGLWRIPLKDGLAGGPEAQILTFPVQQDWAYWAVGRNGIYYVHRKETGLPAFEYFDLATKSTRTVYELKKPPLWNSGGMTVSPDEKSIIFSEVDRDGTSLFVK